MESGEIRRLFWERMVTCPMDAKLKIDKCKAQILLSEPWWASMLLRLRIKEDNSIPTMATDGTSLLYNSKFTESLDLSEVKGVLLHEVAHCVLLHPFRRGARDPFRWNYAADGAVNAVLLAAGIRLPQGGVPPEELELLTEEIYEKLPPAQKISCGIIGVDLKDPGEDISGEGKDESSGSLEVSMTEAAWRDAVAEAKGLMPAGIARAIQEAMESKVPWQELLAQFVQSYRKADAHTWNKPSRRVPAAPGWKREPEHRIAVVIDTSGSVDGALLGAFTSELSKIVAVCGAQTYMLSCDAAVHDIVEPGNPLPTEWHGGGGTDFRPALELVDTLDVECVIYLTDGQGTFPAAPPRTPTLWALSERTNVPFGEAIYLEPVAS